MRAHTIATAGQTNLFRIFSLSTGGDWSRRNKKGHRYIVPVQGSPEPVKNTQAVPHFGALTSLRFFTSKLAILNGTLKVQYLFTCHDVFYTLQKPKATANKAPPPCGLNKADKSSSETPFSLV